MEETIKEKKTKESAEAERKKHEDRVVRILSEDVEGKMSLVSGLTKIKGVSWSFSNAVCHALKMDKHRRVGSLNEQEIKKIGEFIKNPEIPSHLLNRRKDFDSGENLHFTGADLDLKKEFDIKRLKKIKSYRGFRHSAGLPTRGQRTKGNFRPNKSKGAGIRKKK